MNKGGKCFVATAAYGSELANEVECLRHFRDEQLSRTYCGNKMVALYYKIGPIAADFLNTHPNLKPFVRSLLNPIVRTIGKKSSS